MVVRLHLLTSRRSIKGTVRTTPLMAYVIFFIIIYYIKILMYIFSHFICLTISYSKRKRDMNWCRTLCVPPTQTHILIKNDFRFSDSQGYTLHYSSRKKWNEREEETWTMRATQMNFHIYWGGVAVVDGYLKYIYSLNGQTTEWVFVFLHIFMPAVACHHSHHRQMTEKYGVNACITHMWDFATKVEGKEIDGEYFLFILIIGTTSDARNRHNSSPPPSVLWPPSSLSHRM